MISVLKRFGASLPAIAVFAAMLFVPASADAPGDEGKITLQLDQATIMKVPERVATIVVGNPLIADITLQPGNIAVLTGKGYGVTNMMALDRSGAVLTEKTIQVKGPGGNLVTVYKGVNRESYDCAPKCEPRNKLGDAQQYFDGTLNQIATRSGLAQGLSPDNK
jgi:hypothetical protein